MVLGFRSVGGFKSGDAVKAAEVTGSYAGWPTNKPKLRRAALIKPLGVNTGVSNLCC